MNKLWKFDVQKLMFGIQKPLLSNYWVDNWKKKNWNKVFLQGKKWWLHP